MLCYKVVTTFAISLILGVNGMPQNNQNNEEYSVLQLPFLKLTTDGIKVNFGGYHAEAGLGGFLGGSKTGGGLHASAGTPWGANAAAGLGGLLGGDNGNAGGGLFARAGLGRTSAAAGLGGVLDGSGSSSPAAGGLFAGATTGNHGAAVSKEFTGVANANNNPTGPNNPQGNEEKDEATAKGRSNIQIISHPGVKPHKIKHALAEGAVSTESPKNVESASKQIHETEAKVDVSTKVLPNPEEVTFEKYHNRVKLVYPKWVVRRRIWGPRKQIIFNSAVKIEDTPGANAPILSRR